MSLSSNDLQQIAESLFKAKNSGQPCSQSPTESFPQITSEEAYQVSKLCFDRHLLAHREVRPVGKKIGLTSLAVQKQLGVSEPDFGFISSDMIFKSGASLADCRLIQAKVEGEVAFVLKSDFDRADLSYSEVLSKIESVVTCIEVIDSRVKDWKIKIQDTIADNASSACVVMSREQHSLKDFDLLMAGMTLWLNGEVESTGAAAACLGNPLHSLQWLAKKMIELETPLKKGDLVLAGAFGPVIPFKKGDRCRVSIKGIGSAECHW